MVYPLNVLPHIEGISYRGLSHGEWEISVVSSGMTLAVAINYVNIWVKLLYSIVVWQLCKNESCMVILTLCIYFRLQLWIENWKTLATLQSADNIFYFPQVYGIVWNEAFWLAGERCGILYYGPGRKHSKNRQTITNHSRHSLSLSLNCKDLGF